jgi:Mg-chelatase subunit ChlD
MNRRILAAFLVVTTFLACGVPLGAPDAAPTPENLSPADMEATIEARVRATTNAQAPTISPTGAPPPTTTQVTFAPSPQASATTVVESPISATVAQGNVTAPAVESQQGAPAEAPVVFQPGAGGEGKQIINIQLVFDSSGSMAEDIGGESKIQAARRAMEQTIASIPDNPNLNVGFRVFGHKGDNTEAGKAESCQSTELVAPMQGVDKNVLRQRTNEYQPVGWTPITLALQKAGEDLQATENARNIIIMVTDGEETCAGDPCAVAKALAESGAEVRIDVVGFGLTPEVANTLKCIGENSGGSYTDARDGATLGETLTRLFEETIERSYLRITSVGPNAEPGRALEIQSVVNEEGQPIELRDPRYPFESGNPLIDGELLLQLEPGAYRFTVKPSLTIAIGVQPLVQEPVTYTAIVAEGQETVATIGYGTLTLEDAGTPPNFICQLNIEKAVGNGWQVAWGFPYSGTVCPTGLGANRPYEVMPGRYRLVNPENGNVLVDNLEIKPGTAATIQVKVN